MSEIQSNNIFENGALWLRADFHLHTNADSEFNYQGDPNFFVTSYVQKLIEQKIFVGAITNHNKFDFPEFKELRKNASKNSIYLIPGVEFSVKDGSKGIHVLILFDDEWIYNSENHNYIQDFITSAFVAISGYSSSPYKNSNLNFEETCAALTKFGKDFFIVLPHVDESSGLFGELSGRGLEDFMRAACFKNVLAFQKVRSRDNIAKAKTIINGEPPVSVEGTDCASNGIDGIGLGNLVNGESQKCFIKLGSYNFEALKFALLDHKNRVASVMPLTNKAWIKSITFTTNKESGKKLSFSPAMNNLIGIRGSGKSSLLETVRYALDISLGKNSHEPNYKDKLVQNLLGSGGKMKIELEDKHGKLFLAEKIYGEATNIYADGILQNNLKIQAIINKPLYYGQKDLSDIGGETSTEDLINKLMGDKLTNVKLRIEEQNAIILSNLGEIDKVNKTLAQKKDIEEKKAAIELNMKIFKDYQVDKKLNKQLEFDKDSNRIDSMVNFENMLIDRLQELYTEFEGLFINHYQYKSLENPVLFEDIYASITRFQKVFLGVKNVIDSLNLEKSALETIKEDFSLQYETLKEEFSQIKREINLPNIEADAYVRLSKDFDLQNAKLVEIEKLSVRKQDLRNRLNESLTKLKNLWHEEYMLVQEEVNKINAEQQKIRIEVTFKGNKEKYKEFLKASVRGSNLRDSTISDIADEYPDLIEVYNNLSVEGSELRNLLSGGSNLHNFTNKYIENIGAFLTYRVQDKYTIYYNDRPLNEHSLGQRASALILFILTLKENDIIVIDQPEDDLDNQTIYTDVITELKKLKSETQFIFATHNPNIPVLGDCEQIICCSYDKGIVNTEVGGIDDTAIQKKIVDIMEGGEEAFNHRKVIYELWKH
ncbi:MAG: histidinol-phosphatase [Flavobacterium sp.]|nr:MAG: histidinol-phosphatase [Flavobacterium sp.]